MYCEETIERWKCSQRQWSSKQSGSFGPFIFILLMISCRCSCTAFMNPSLGHIPSTTSFPTRKTTRTTTRTTTILPLIHNLQQQSLRPKSRNNKNQVGCRESGSNNNNNDDIRKDPNPGGLNNFDDGNSNSNGGGDDENFLETFKNWLRSDEGREDIQTYAISLSVALLLRMFIIEPRYIPSLSMYPTFDIGDQLAVEKVSKRIRPLQRNEVVVFNPPQGFRNIIERQFGEESAKAKEALIKRIVAVEGDEVLVKDGKLCVNGKVQDEPFTAEDAQYDYGPIIVPPNRVLVLGDNRNHSLDGHIWGFLPKENVIGRAVFIYWPPWRIGSEGMY